MRDIEEIGKAVDKIYKDMYIGDGKENPSITTRLFDAERTISDIKTLKVLLYGAILTGIAEIIFTHIKM
jgi:hypothetical protein